MKKIPFENLPSVKTPMSAQNLNKMQNNIEEAIEENGGSIKLNTISETAPINADENDRYYNKTENKIYIYNTEWIEEGTPHKGIVYINLEDECLYYYNGTDMIKASSSNKGVYIGSEEPTDEDTNTWVNPNNGIIQYKNNNSWNGALASSDTLPIGSIIEFDGDTIPYGYELYEDGTPKKIKKVKNAIGLVGKIVTDTTSQNEDEVLNVKTIINYVNNQINNNKKAKYVSDLNTCFEPGIYRFNPATANKPYENNYIYGAVLLIAVSDKEFDIDTGWKWQIAFNTIENNIYVRLKVNANSWSSWRKIPTEAIS